MNMRKKKVGRPKLEKDKKKVSIKVTLSPEVIEEAEKSGNVSGWLDDVGKLFIRKKKQKENNT